MPYRYGGLVDESWQRSFAGRRAAFGGELGLGYKSKLLAGAVLLEGEDGALYARAMASRRRLQTAFAGDLESIDALLTPTVPDFAPPIGDLPNSGLEVGQYTRATNVTGHPSLTIPNGTDDEGLPVGLQLVGSAFDDARLLGVGDCVAATIETT